MTLREKIYLAIIGVALLAFDGYEWLQQHDALVKAEAAAAVQQKTIDQAKADAATAQQTLAAQLKALQIQSQLPATAPQIVLDASKLFPNLPAPLKVVTPPPTMQLDNGKTTELPSAPVVEIPQVDFAALQQGAITCQANADKLDACTKELADSQTEVAAATQQRDEYKSAAKGGSWLRRALTAAKWIGIGAGVGIAVSRKW